MWFTSRYGLLCRAVASAGIGLIALVAVVVYLLAVLAVAFPDLVQALFVRRWAQALAAAIVALVLTGLASSVAGQVTRERRRLLEDTVPVSEAAPGGDRTVQTELARLAARFDVPVPELRVRSCDAPLAYTTYRPTDPLLTGADEPPVVVVSDRLVETLSRPELVAVLAHEVAHVANDDLRLTGWLLVPLFAADETDVEPVAESAVGLFSRGREIAADRTAAQTVGDPGALASALRTLHESAPSRPTEDLRGYRRTASAINVHPVGGGERGDAAVSTHPPLETRLEHLAAIDAD